MTEVTIQGTAAGYGWYGQPAYKPFEIRVGDGPFQDSGTLRQLILSKVVSDGDFQCGAVAEGYVEVSRWRNGQRRTRWFDLSMFPSISDCWCDSELAEILSLDRYE